MSTSMYTFSLRQRFHERTARRQRCQPGRDDRFGYACTPGLHCFHGACTRYYEDGKKIAPEIEEEIYANLAKMEEINGKKFGDKENPLLVSVRSGARASMPGMMDTILNLA